MSRFYVTAQGQAGECSRRGSVASGIRSHTRGWCSGVKVYGSVDAEARDVFQVIQTGGSNAVTGERELARIVDGRLYLHRSTINRAEVIEDAGEPSPCGKAEEAGYAAGVAAGSWVIDGNTSEETARAILRGIEDGDPLILDGLPSAPLSGEWADGLTPRDVLGWYDLSEDASEADEVLSAFEDGFSRGVTDEVVRSARAIV